ncbi:uncharacterized protein LOC142576477 [Dermacentor variabilis]|uniref:uncharacterized protein LOC142576477 n=1 Tax=Dermacentor variabilis TaxID=34621 RepID=UPI003F5B95B5
MLARVLVCKRINIEKFQRYSLVATQRRLFRSICGVTVMQLKAVLVGLAILGLIHAGSEAAPVGPIGEDGTRADSVTADRADQSSEEEARFGEGCMESLCR